MAYELSWQFLTNVTYFPASTLDASRYSMWWVASCLVGGTAGFNGASGLWTIYGSSDSSTAGINDTTDRLKLKSAYDGTKWVRNSGGVHSWLVLKSPVINGANWYMTFDFNTSGDHLFNFYFSKAAPTGGTTSARATATDEWQPAAGSTLTAVYSSQLTTPMRLSMGLTTRGDFWNTWARAGAKEVDRIIHFQGTADYNVSDGYPVWAAAIYYANTGGAYSANQLNNNGTYVYSRWYTGSIATAYLFTPITSNGNFWKPDLLSFTYLLLPFHVLCANSSVQGTIYRGRVQDFFVTPGNAGFGLPSAPYPVLRESGAVKYVGVGNAWIPCNVLLNMN
jgi:hypothetical protein